MVVDCSQITNEDFDKALKNILGPSLYAEDVRAVAVAVSGGADSMLLVHLLSDWAREFMPEMRIHALTVDHGLRQEARAEAEDVGERLSCLPSLEHHILTWDDGGQTESRIQERAREARYDLMRSYMQREGVRYLFSGHHMDDQAETFLYRLAKGSGLDGLSCMNGVQDIGNGLLLARPFLGFSKSSLLVSCQARGIEFIDDPSNENDAFARVRLRQSMDVLAQEGLTNKRLSQTAMRLSRARVALEDLSERAYKGCAISCDPECIVFNFDDLVEWPDEIVFRVFLLALHALSDKEGYGPRMERAEDLFYDLMQPNPFRKRTLHGVIIELNAERSRLIMTKEGL